MAVSASNASFKLCCCNLTGVRMSNFAAADTKQSKLSTTTVRKENTNTNQPITSFFDSVDRENKNKLKISEPEPLGLLAYMTDYNPTSNMSNHKNATEKQAPAKGLDRYQLKRKNVWDDVESLPVSKQPKSGTKGAVTICSLLDNSDSNPDPWAAFENSLAKQAPPNASTPYVPKPVAAGPLDNFCDAENVTSPWKDLAATKTKASEHAGSKVAAKPVESYFTKTKSVWAEYEQPSDDDIVCISDTPKPQPKKKLTKTKGQGRGKRGCKPLVNMFQAGTSRSTSQESTHSKRTVLPRKAKQAQANANADVVSSVDCEVITIDSD